MQPVETMTTETLGASLKRTPRPPVGTPASFGRSLRTQRELLICPVPRHRPCRRSDRGPSPSDTGPAPGSPFLGPIRPRRVREPHFVAAGFRKIGNERQGLLPLVGVAVVLDIVSLDHVGGAGHTAAGERGGVVVGADPVLEGPARGVKDGAADRSGGTDQRRRRSHTSQTPFAMIPPRMIDPITAQGIPLMLFAPWMMAAPPAA